MADPDHSGAWHCLTLTTTLPFARPHSRPDPNYDSRYIDFGIQQVHASGVNLNQHVVLPHLRLRHFANPYAAFVSIAVDDKRFHDIFSTGTASSRRSLRIPASTRPAGANLRSNRRRLASPPAG